MRILKVLTVLFAIAAGSQAQAGQDLRAPYSLAQIRATKGETLKPGFRCGALAAAVRDLNFESMYVRDGTGSNIDPESHAEYRDAAKPINRLERRMATLANAYAKSEPPAPELARCVIDQLYVWSQDGALLGNVNAQGEAVRKWTLASLASAYIQVMDAQGQNEQKKRAIRAWFADVSAAVMADYERYPDNASRNNNHAYWAGWAVGQSAVIVNDPRRLAWAITRAKIGLNQVDSKGFLPLELKRQKLAFNYHVFAAAPLVALADLAQANGVDLRPYNNQALRRLVRTIAHGVEDLDVFMQASGGHKQDISRTNTGAMFAWMRVYQGLDSGFALPSAVKGYGAPFQVRLGGDMNLLHR